MIINKIFLKLDEMEQDYVIRLTANASFAITTSGFLLPNFVIVEKEKSE